MEGSDRAHVIYLEMPTDVRDPVRCVIEVMHRGTVDGLDESDLDIEGSAWPEYPEYLIDVALRIHDVLENRLGQDQVETVVSKR